jgi:hypothetical protein
MKRVGFLFDKFINLDNIKFAIYNSLKDRKRKRLSKMMVKVRDNPEYYAVIIQQLILSGNFEFCAPLEREIQDFPKTRHLRKPRFYPDQIIMWSLKQVVEPVLSRGQYLYSFGGIKGRGNLKAKRYVERVVRETGNKRLYVYQDDIKHFYDNIDNDKLKQLFRTVIKDNRVLVWLDKIVDIGGKGLPIGFPTSPLFGNFYLKRFDHYIKENFSVKYYSRFADDLFLADSNRRKLKSCILKISVYLNFFNLRLKRLRPIFKLYKQTIDFVGYQFKNGYIYLRDRTFYNLNRIVKNIQRIGGTLKRYMRFTSLLGMFKHINFKNYYLKNIKPIVSISKREFFLILP